VFSVPKERRRTRDVVRNARNAEAAKTVVKGRVVAVGGGYPLFMYRWGDDV
jgi:hypothetical protein